MIMAMKPVKIRFDAYEYEAIKELSAEYHMSYAQIVRIAVAGNLTSYFGKVRYVDRNQANDIKGALLSVGNTLTDIRNQLKRIGVNYNQEIKLKNLERVLKEKEQTNTFGSYTLVTQKRREIDDIKRQIKTIQTDRGRLNKAELDNLISRVDKAVVKFGDAVCHIAE